jgi:BirA family biotin operon repressor/biotin-[acetyl-CoA-carboxylase] ligase
MLEKLSEKKILSALDDEVRTKLTALEIFETIDSTNTYMLSRAKMNAASGSVCLADQQTQGRGRHGKHWISPAGTNIYCSILWHFSKIQSDFSGLSLAVAVMVMRALKKYGVERGIQLKWPNDIWYAGKKLSGILLETHDQKSVVIGIGLNVLSAPESENSISVAEIIQQVPPRNALVGMLINELWVGLELFQQKGLTVFLDEWREYDVLVGKKVDVHLPDKMIAGVMCGVDEMGKLMMRDGEGKTQSFCYGEVSVRF